MTIKQDADSRAIFKAAINRLFDEIPVDELVDAMAEAAKDRAALLMTQHGMHSTACKWLIIERAIRRAILVTEASEL